MIYRCCFLPSDVFGSSTLRTLETGRHPMHVVMSSKLKSPSLLETDHNLRFRRFSHSNNSRGWPDSVSVDLPIKGHPTVRFLFTSSYDFIRWLGSKNWMEQLPEAPRFWDKIHDFWLRFSVRKTKPDLSGLRKLRSLSLDGNVVDTELWCQALQAGAVLFNI